MLYVVALESPFDGIVIADVKDVGCKCGNRICTAVIYRDADALYIVCVCIAECNGVCDRESGSVGSMFIPRYGIFNV